MSNVKHKIGFGFEGTTGFGEPEEATFYILSQAGDTITSQDDNKITTQNG